ncbi:MAG: phosphate ABC transporter substrate-binding protein PstS [Syntrophobacteraceae bacterium]|nr:phosphate ABC transporter substrate-binding protein PstS [Syntrophobacteraceae bacterium]
MNIRNALTGFVVFLISFSVFGYAWAADGSVRLTGAGASFPAPLYDKWFKDFHGLHQGILVDYQSVGSGSGVRNFINKTVDFGASDAAMSPEQIAQVKDGAVLLPMTAGSIVLAYNLPGVTDLKLSRRAYAGIFLGKVTKWNDPSIAKTNPGVKLPDSPVNVIVRADSSGTTNVFTRHLAAISPQFAKSPGINNMPDWPVGTRSKGNEGVTAGILTTPGSIGYIEYGYAIGQQVPMATLENKAGKFVKPTMESAVASLAAVKLPENLIAWLPDPDGDSSYPIVTFTWMLFYKHYSDAGKLKAVQDVVAYCLTEGQKSSQQLGYIPLPASVVARDKAALQAIQAR